MKYYAVIDTNVLVFAMLKWNSVPGNVMELTFSGTIIPLLNVRFVNLNPLAESKRIEYNKNRRRR